MSFVILDVSNNIIAEAQRMRTERDKRYGNIFIEGANDMRWVGEIGEICFNSWAKGNTHTAVEWITNDAAGKPDFLIANVPIGMKTVKRQVGMMPGYTAQITAKHAKEPVRHFFFASYEFPRQKLWLLGGITREEFLKKARYYKAGEQVHSKYIIREGHEIYNINVNELTPPQKWIATF